MGKKKMSKKSVVHETSEEQTSSSEDVEEVEIQGECPITRLKRVQASIRAGDTGSRETQLRLNNRSSLTHHQIVLKNGKKITRRNPDIPFRPRPRKPVSPV